MVAAIKIAVVLAIKKKDASLFYTSHSVDLLNHLGILDFLFFSASFLRIVSWKSKSPFCTTIWANILYQIPTTKVPCHFHTETLRLFTASSSIGIFLAMPKGELRTMPILKEAFLQVVTVGFYCGLNGVKSEPTKKRRNIQFGKIKDSMRNLG